MMTILLHSSKTMRSPVEQLDGFVQEPALQAQAEQLASRLKVVSAEQLQKMMTLSVTKAQQTYELIQAYSPTNPRLAAIDIFLGDIYSGLQVRTLTDADRRFANENRLFILSGLYGVLRPLDAIQPYRLEMGYKIDGQSLYDYWGDDIAKQLPAMQPIINLSAVEYTKVVFPALKKLYGDATPRVVTPKFLTKSPKTGEPTFVTVHTKIARGAFARWLIQNRVESLAELKNFQGIGYHYDPKLSTNDEPVFVANVFKGLGLSVRLT